MSDLVSGVGEGVVGVGDFGYFCGKMVFNEIQDGNCGAEGGGHSRSAEAGGDAGVLLCG